MLLRYLIFFQVICNHKLMFIHCFSGFPGSVHDARVFKHSGVQNMCNEQFFFDDYHLLADSAYTLQNHVITPYKNNGHLTDAQTNFNTKLSKTRIYVECSIGLLKMRWRRILDYCHINNTEMIPFYILACCILHNICLRRDEDFEYPVIIDNDALINNEYEGPIWPDRQTRLLGARKRNLIKGRFQRERN